MSWWSKFFKYFLILFFLAAVLSGGSWYAVFKLAVWILIAAMVGWYVKPRWAFWFLALAGVFESLVGFLQFITHKSVGLYFLGESFLGPLNREVARTFIEGGRLLRAYGTFPHPNILGAFLVLASLACCYLFITMPNKKEKYVLIVLFFIILLGLLLTFSRAAWLAAAASFIAMICVTRSKEIAMAGVVSCIALGLLFFPIIFPRLNVEVGNFAVRERVVGYQESFAHIAEHPWFGGGLTLAMPTDRAPTHNLFLLIAEEVGLIGLAVFLVFIVLVLKSRFWTGEIWVLKIMLIALLVIGIFDHFLWTLRPGIAMLWGVIGLVWQGNIRARSSTDRMQPSEG